MQVIVAPDMSQPIYPTTLFLGGGISGCPNWQEYVITKLSGYQLTIWNPRRKTFQMNDRDAAQIQTDWEIDRLRIADINAYWFSSGTLNPIALVEIGESFALRERIVLGMDQEYARKWDLEFRMDKYLPWEAISYTLDDFVKNIKDAFHMHHMMKRKEIA
jgi:Nucleoside 2-deoxyribosyltransferase like